LFRVPSNLKSKIQNLKLFDTVITIPTFLGLLAGIHSGIFAGLFDRIGETFKSRVLFK
jgi:hypothetical protein